MREAFRRKLTFIGKSLIWSIFMYFATIAILDWNFKEANEPVVVEVKYNPSASIKIDASIQHGLKGTTYSLSKLPQRLGNIISYLLD